MEWEVLIQSFLLILMPILAVVIVELKNLLYAAIVLGAESVVLAVIFYMTETISIASAKGIGPALEWASLPFKVTMAIFDVSLRVVRFTIELVDRLLTWMMNAVQTAKPT